MTNTVAIVFVLLTSLRCTSSMETTWDSMEMISVRPGLTWPTIESAVKRSLDKYLIQHVAQLSALFKQLQVSSECKEDVIRLVWAIRNLEGWAYHMVDSSGKPPSGLLGGTAMDFGNFDGCLKLRVRVSSGDAEAFRGRYCMVGYHTPLLSSLSTKTPDGRSYEEAYGKPPDWMGDILNRTGAYLKRSAFWYGTCVPSTCSENDVKQVSSALLMPFGFTVKTAGCYTDGPKEWATSAVTAVCVLSLLLGLAILGTAFDVVARCLSDSPSEQSCLLSKVLRAFSVYSNIEKMFDIPGSYDALGCFNGIRFCSAVWIILGHTYWFTDNWKYLKYRNALAVDDHFNYYLPAAFLENFSIPVGSFFFMSGFLLVFTSWKKLQKTGGKMNVPMFIVHKYWRMTPALGLMIAMFLALPAIGRGPLWDSALGPPIRACEARWWTNMLYINNFWGSEEYCIIHTWYLPALMQFHILGAILLLVTFRWPVAGAALGFALTVASCVTTALITIWNDFPMPTPAINKDLDLMDSYNSKVYIKPFAHVPSYFIGMLVAFIIFKYKDVTLGWRSQLIGGLLAAACGLSSVLGLYAPAQDVLTRAFYISCHRIGWSLAVAWLGFVCISGNGGVINRILSWKAFVPLGQLSYLVYLLHPLIMLYRTATLKERIHYSHIELVFEFMTYTVVAFILSFVGHVAVEKPFLILEGILLGRRSDPDKKSGSDAPHSPKVDP